MIRRSCRTIVLALVFATLGLPASAEVSTDILAGGQVQIVILGSTEGPDPWGMSWIPIRDIPLFRVLNPDGDVRGDGRPDVALTPGGVPVVAWAWNVGMDHDIAVAEWTPDGWSVPQFLTGSANDELDPRLVATDSGTLHLVWWGENSETVHHTTRQHGTNLWALPSIVTAPGARGRRPSVAVWDDQVFVAFERDSDEPEIAQEVVIKVRNPDGSFSDTVAARTPRARRLDPVLHSEAGWLWMDWKESDSEIAYVINGGEGWSEVATVPWTDTSWIGVEDARQAVRQLVLAQGVAPIVAADKDETDGPERQTGFFPRDLDAGLPSAPTAWDVNQGSGPPEPGFRERRK